MGTPHLSDLRREFYGSRKTEHEALSEAAAAGVTFSQLIAAAQAVASEGGESADLSGMVTAHDTNAAAHDGVVRWGTVGLEDGKLFLQPTEPADVPGVWFEV